VYSVVISTVVCTPYTRSMIGIPASLRWPMPKIVVQIVAMETTKAPAIASGAGQRAASHSNGGNVKASGLKDIQDWVGWACTEDGRKASSAATLSPSV